MCVIGYAPPNQKIDEETLETMFYNNPDGAGIMYREAPDKPVEIKKGFMTFEALLKAWKAIPIEYEKAVHCRIATAGRIGAACCHPFPVRETTRSMKSRSTNTDMAIMHNGIITITDPPMGMKSPFSDSMMFAKEILYPIKNALSNPFIQEMLENSINHSRMLIFRQHGDVVMLGNWVKEGKCFFSNSSYKDTWYTYSKYSSGYSYKSDKAVTTTATDTKKKEDTAAKNTTVKELPATTTTVVQPVGDKGLHYFSNEEMDVLNDLAGYDMTQEEAMEFCELNGLVGDISQYAVYDKYASDDSNYFADGYSFEEADVKGE